MVSIPQILKRLNDHGVEYVVVGGAAATMHGSARGTLDLDICSPLNRANLQRILDALRDINPRFRFHPAKPALWDDVDRLVSFRNLNLETDLGPLDILGEITGIGGFEEVARQVISMDLGGSTIRVLNLAALVEAKRAVGRRKDLLALPELERLRDQTPPHKD